MNEDNVKNIRQLLINCVCVPGVSEESWTEENVKPLDQFVADTSIPVAVVYVHRTNGLQVDFSTPYPGDVVEGLFYFTRPLGAIITEENFADVMQFDSVRGDPLHTMLADLTCIYAPAVAATLCTEEIKDEFTKELYFHFRWLGDILYRRTGETFLYIPVEAQHLSAEEASKDGKLVERLETMMMYWSAQIHEMLEHQEARHTRHDQSLLEEIAFWESYSMKLSEIIKWREKPQVKHIQEILQLAKSSRLQWFLEETTKVQECSLKVKKTLSLLGLLKESHKELLCLKPREIMPKLYDIVFFIRVIWNNAPHFNTSERIIGLFYKVTNEIIRLCSVNISLDRIFEGHVISSKQVLNDCIHCCEHWKDMYLHVSKIYHTCAPTGWVLDKKFFDQIDAFINRLKNLLEVCEWQDMPFVRWKNGQERDILVFGGHTGSEVASRLVKIQTSFNEALENLRSFDKAVFDLQNMTWTKDFHRFCESVSNIEKMIPEVINLAFADVVTFQGGVRIWDFFHPMTKSKTIGPLLEEKSKELISIFTTELKLLIEKGNQSTCKWYIPYHLPKSVGQAMRARGLKNLLEEHMKMYPSLPQSAICTEIISLYGQTVQVLDDIVRKNFLEWSQKLDEQPMNKLKRPLLVRCRNMKLDSNFDKELLELIAEVQGWERMGFEIPRKVSDIKQIEEDIRILREKTGMLVRSYNRVIGQLSPDERVLFSEQLIFMDSKIRPGLTELLWSDQRLSNHFIDNSLPHVDKMQSNVDRYRVANMSISNICKQISEKLLVKIDDKTVYSNLKFEEEQKAHQQSRLQALRSKHMEIFTNMTQIWSLFGNQNAEVRNHLVAYTERVDDMVENAFHCNIRDSMNKLCRAITEDNKMSHRPLFEVVIVLRKSSPKSLPKLEFSPSEVELKEAVNILPQLISIISEFKRLPELLSCKESNANPIHINIEQDEDIKKTQAEVTAGISAIAEKLKAYLNTWSKHKHIWEEDMDRVMQGYKNTKASGSCFDEEIQRYSGYTSSIQNEDTIVAIQFVMLDCSPLKASLGLYCSEWQKRFLQLLLEMITSSLQELHRSMQNNADRLMKHSQTLEEFKESQTLLETVKGGLDRMEAEFPLIHDRFAILDKYEVPVEENVQAMREQLNDKWIWFKEVLIQSDIVLKKDKEMLKNNLLLQFEESKIYPTVQEFLTKGPIGSNLSIDQALKQIEEHRARLEALKQEQLTILHGLSFFEIKQNPDENIHTMEKDLGNLQQAWEISQEWEENRNNWKDSHLAQLQTQSMERAAIELFNKLQILQKDLRGQEWEIVNISKSKIERFKQILSLITDLKNPALKDRHWRQICKNLKCTFDPTSADFTLERILSLKLDLYAGIISKISGAASKELSIEQGLESVKNTWDKILLDIVPYEKEGHFFLRGTENIFQAVDDTQVILSKMRASCYVEAFEAEVDQWEQRLSHLLEVVEMILAVQRNWIYLENRLAIMNKLSNKCKEFVDLSENWKTIMAGLYKNNNALEGTRHPGLLEKLSNINQQLEEILKTFDTYLVSKRQSFPRFYFLSNDNVLEILGHSGNPESMQPYVKKCFCNTKGLWLDKVAKKTEMQKAIGIYSDDGEVLVFQKPVDFTKEVEIWLCDIENHMKTTVSHGLRTYVGQKRVKGAREELKKNLIGQVLITGSQIEWTSDVNNCLSNGAKNPSLKSLMEKQISTLKCYSEMIYSDLSNTMRLKVVALITVKVHARDIIDKLIKTGCKDANAFEWLCQLRYYLDRDKNCIIRQTDSQFKYGCEFLGNSGRLVNTPLTDRCYMTLTTALHLHRGGSLKGPAGTGKTETVKDLSKSLGMHFVVVNCSEGLGYKSMGRLFSGLAQTGAWGCFDEFNHINMEVLSVVAQQIHFLLSALSAVKSMFQFEGQEIRLVPSCGIFITMSPGYAGCTELPDNLKSMFRPVSMVVPDSAMITQILLLTEGFHHCTLLAKKVVTLYSLAEQQLSMQDHYNFGLCALTSLIHYAGKKRRLYPWMEDENILRLALVDMNIPRLTSADLPLFHGIIQDLFPDVATPVTDYSKLKDAIEMELRQSGFQVNSFTVTKAIQLYETKNSRHSSMLVGKTCSAKTVTWRILQQALNALNQKGEPDFKQVQDFPLNPKSMSLGELYGHYHLSTNRWIDGVLSSLMRSACAEDTPDEKWIVLDGPVDTLWVESLNSVMDDNKVLTLINGERIFLADEVSILFEVENLATASPATVSRCAIVYNDYDDLGWKPYLQSWLEKRPKVEIEHLKEAIDKYLETSLDFKKTNCRELIPITELNGVMSLCRLYDSLATPSNGVNTSDTESLGMVVELWFTFSLIWSICASVDEDGLKKMDYKLRVINSTFPAKDTVYDYYVDPKNKSWVSFENQLPKNWHYDPSAPFYEIMVPTVDTVRYNLLVKALVLNKHPVLLTGPVGTGKTCVAQNVLQGLDKKCTAVTINMSAQMTSNKIQNIIERRVKQRTRGVFFPAAGRKMLCFLDDLNMPAHDQFGSQPPLELLRFWIDYGFWYDHQKQTRRYIKDTFLLATMGPPGVGRTQISSRFQSSFHVINMTFPSDSRIKCIFGTIMNQKLHKFERVWPLAETVTQATLKLYDAVKAAFLPTPAKIHYLFNLRDISKVFQGLLRAHPHFHDTKKDFTRLWIHECFRVFSDRLVNQSDTNTFINLLKEILASHFDLTLRSICSDEEPPIFGDFMSESHVYEDIVDQKTLKKFMETQLKDYNKRPGVVPVNLVLFTDAIKHIIRIVRVIGQPRGNMLLVGIGCSGRQSLSKMAAFICGYQIFQVEMTKQFNKEEFREDIKKLYRLAGVDNKPTVFLFNDTQIVDESFLEDINNILSSGEVPNLYTQDELAEVCKALSEVARKEEVQETPDSLFSYLIDQVRNNLHIVFCMSPMGKSFRNRILQYPAIVNCTTIDWFSEWPKDALLEVAEKSLNGLDLGSLEGIHGKVANIFVTTHQSVVQLSQRMKLELKKYNYVSPTDYLELLSGYKELLEEKRCELGEQISKLQKGLFKISDTQQKVTAMTLELEDAKKQVVDLEKESDQYLSIIAKQKMEADDQQRRVVENSKDIQAEELQCKAMAENAQRELDKSMPALEEALKALESLNKADMREIKSYGSPPALVETVMCAVMTLLGKEPTWAEAKRQLGKPDFIKTLINFDKDAISDRILSKVNGYYQLKDFQPEVIGNVSLAAKSLCMWVRAMVDYGHIYREVEPKQAQLKAAMCQIKEKETAFAKAKQKLKELAEELNELQEKLAKKLIMKENLRQKSQDMEEKLDRADKLVKGLAGEKVRWAERVAGLEKNMGYLVGDCLLAASFLTYMGSFLSNCRDELLNNWIKEILESKIQFSPGFSFAGFLSNPAAVRNWKTQGLQSDTFSTENGVIITHFSRWPLIIDPQGQALKWIKNMEKDLKVIDFQMPDFLRILENAIQDGNPVLLQNVQEELDPSLNPVLNKSLIHIDGRLMLKLCDKNVEYNPEFRFYITTKMPNPHFRPEISSKTTIVNFAVKEQGLESQLLGILVRMERSDLEQQKDSLVITIADHKQSLQDLEDKILRQLNEASGSLLDDVQLINTLQVSKETAITISEQLERSQQTELKIDSAREAYRPCAQRASILFFVLNDMNLIDPMYQFSLDAYIELFTVNIAKSMEKDTVDLEKRIRNLNDYHTYAVYRYACQGLFEAHKLIFSFQMCIKIPEVATHLNMDELRFFLRGGVVIDNDDRIENPYRNWLPDSSWDNITELDKLLFFNGIVQSFKSRLRDWKLWYTNPEPEKAPLPDVWEYKVNIFQKLLIVRSLRQDRLSFCIRSFISYTLGDQFQDPPVLDMKAVADESTCCTPLIFLLTPGVDPKGALMQLAEASGMKECFKALSLGQGQAPIAKSLIEEGVKSGHWVYLANCHLCLSWMPELDKLIRELQVQKTNPNFRLWLSSSPHPKFPITILQAGITMTIEQPKGLKANMKHLYQMMKENHLNRCTKPTLYEKLLYSLCFFHSIMLERRKFRQMGWNAVYSFSDSDFEASESLLCLYLEKYEEVPWDALRCLIAGVIYGGHITDEWDRRLLNTYFNDYFCEAAVTRYNSLAGIQTTIYHLPTTELPEVFGQHPNAEIASQITENCTLFNMLLSLQPQETGDTSAVARPSKEETVLELLRDLHKKIPTPIDCERTRTLLQDNQSPLKVVLLQEIQSYNSLLETIISSLKELEKGIKGYVVMSPDMEETFNYIYNGQVPPLWEKAYLSLKPLGAWMQDLCQRVDQFACWARTLQPPIQLWLSGFTRPNSLLTAVLQSTARKHNIPVEKLSWEFVVSTVDDRQLCTMPEDGVYITGLYLEGAGWDRWNSCLVDPEPMEMVCRIPTIHFKPVKKSKKMPHNIYPCPVYYIPARAGRTGRPSFVVTVQLQSGAVAPEHWIKRGTALLMSLEN